MNQPGPRREGDHSQRVRSCGHPAVRSFPADTAHREYYHLPGYKETVIECYLHASLVCGQVYGQRSFGVHQGKINSFRDRDVRHPCLRDYCCSCREPILCKCGAGACSIYHSILLRTMMFKCRTSIQCHTTVQWASCCEMQRASCCEAEKRDKSICCGEMRHPNPWRVEQRARNNVHAQVANT